MSINKRNPTSYKKEFGFIAQEVKEVFPELVEEDADGLMSVNYIGLIPLLVESVKEQRQIIDEQSKKIEALEKSIAGLRELPGLRSVSESASTLSPYSKILEENSGGAVLYQNMPNPFKERTEIRYILPPEVQSAEIYIFNLQGSLLKKLPALHSGSVVIEGSDLSAGMYVYSLVINGRLIDTKQMILTR